MKEIIGYKLREEFLHCKEYAAHIGEYNNRYDVQEHLLKESDRTLMYGITKLKKAGVFDLWFEPVFKEEFKKDDYVTVVSINTYDYDSSSGETKPVIGKTYKIYNVNTNYISLDVPKGIIAIKSSDLRKATEEEIKKASISLPKINGKQCVDNGDKTITCGCTTKSFDWWLGANEALEARFFIGDIKVELKDTEQIERYINSQKS